MEYIVQDSKWEAETISIILSFADLLASGDYIVGTPAITLTLFTGTDATPSDLLYGVTSVLGGNTVEQRFRLGIPGNIYEITYEVQTFLGEIYEKTTYLAILPDNDSAVPLWLPLWEATQLYPLQDIENLQGSVLFQTGTLQIIIIPYSFSEYLQGTSSLIGGTLYYVIVPYSYEEDMQGLVQFTAGTLTVVVIPYSYEEDLKGASAFLSGTLVVVVVPYSYSYEAMQGAATFTSGTLV